MNKIESIATQIVDAAVKIYKALGSGLLESAYQACLVYELRKRGLTVECEIIQPIPRHQSSDSRQFLHSYGANPNISQVAQLQTRLHHQLACTADQRRYKTHSKLKHLCQDTPQGTSRTRREGDRRQKTDDRGLKSCSPSVFPVPRAQAATSRPASAAFVGMQPVPRL